MTLKQLLQEALGVHSHLQLEVMGIAQDSQDVKPGYLFIARRGERVDGHSFIPQAIARGAVAILGEGYEGNLAVPYITVDNDRVALALVAAQFYGQPAKAMKMFAVTGTDGKTTTAFLLYHLLKTRAATGLLSTAGIKIVDKSFELPGHFTTPEASDVQRILAQCRDAGCQAVVLEASSHALAWHRLEGLDYELAIWTNLSPEHLDFHGSMANYLAAKALLVQRARLSILNRDDAYFEDFAAAANTAVSYGEHPEADWRITELSEARGELHWTLVTKGTSIALSLPMIGRYNVWNATAALIAAHEAGLDLLDLQARLASFPGVPGRMQLVQREPFAVVVDFAHTPLALEKALKAVRAQLEGKLIVVIGAAGERDPGKRGPLAEVAIQNAELAIFTEEDHRSEDIEAILQLMAAAATGVGGQVGRDFWLIPDRREAIARAIALAAEGDVVVLAGKGHERTLERQNEVLVWDEVEEAKKALAK